MRKIRLLLPALILSAGSLMAQVNIQMHYDLGRHTNPDAEADRQYLTATIEQFRPDRLGSIFYFIDLDFYSKGMKGAYIEFSREFNLYKGLAIHGEYNGGLTSSHDGNFAAQFRHAFLIGPAYNWASKDFKYTWGVQAMFKQYLPGRGLASKGYPGVQFTGIWNIKFGKRDMFTFCGFADVWRNHKDWDPSYNDDSYNVILLTEPQLWWNLNSLKNVRKTGLSIGTEWEISKNFIFPTAGTRSWYFNPTIAVKWTM